MTPEALVDFIDNAPEYGAAEFRRLVADAIGAIHQIPHIFYKAHGFKYELKHIEAYFGRSSWGPHGGGLNVYQRFVAGRDERDHEYGIIFARTSIPASLRYERHGILLLDALREADGLCISNNSFAGVGRTGSTGPGLLYVTFRLLGRRPALAREMTAAEIKEMVREYKSRLDENFGSDAAEARGAFESALKLANDTDHFGGQKLKKVNYR